MTYSTEPKTYLGGCHCGGVRFQVTLRNHQALDCNCSICRKKGFLHGIVSQADFQLLQGQDLLTPYSFNTHQAQHLFCCRCGIHSFYHPRSHPDSIDVNLRCLDENILDTLEINFFDGENWEDNIDQIT